MNEERMRELYARHTALRAASDPPCEVSLDAMIDVLEHHGSEDHRREIMAQILRSPACREEFELLRALVRAGEEAEAPAEPEPSFKIPALTPMQWRIAAGIFLLVGVGLIGFIVKTRPANQLRAGGSAIPMYDPRDEERVRSLPGFVYGRVEGAVDYRFQLLSESGAIMYSTHGTDTVVFIPSEVEIPTGRYLWNVTVSMAGGNSINSRTYGVVVAP